MTGDISAFLFDPRQAYTSVRLQQGRVVTDLDWNENERIEDDRRRGLLADLVCGRGSTNNGFRPVAAATATLEVPTGGDGLAPRATYDVRFAQGTFLLGGNLQQWPGGSAQSLLRQDDWLQLSGLDVESLPSVPEAARSDLVYLEAFEQAVRAVEDRELRERALGGPDTSTRLRAMRRVRVLEDVPQDCTAAGDALRAAVTAPGPGDGSGIAHAFDPVTCEVRSKARLTVVFTGPGPTTDLCKPRITQGYLGAENQAIRVELTRANRFLWAYDNGEPLYRVQVSDATPAADGSIELTFLTPPRDPVLFPLQDLVVEVLPWGAFLANAEKTATLRGHLARVTAGYDPGTDTMRIAPAVPLEMQEWLAAANREPILSPRDPEEQRRYFYLRLWQPGPAGSADLDHSFTPGTPLPLPDTGLAVDFSAFGLPGDHWVIAARPNTPDRVVPWRLLDAASPFGPKRFYAALGLVQWEIDAAGNVEASVQDCRHRFRKLCDVETCCTIHVGDGSESHGDTTDLQEAIDRLPPEGGRICLLPGRHIAQAAISDARDVAIHGCGPRSVLVPGDGQTGPLLTIRESRRVTLADFELDSPSTLLVDARRSADLAMSRLEMRARDRGAVVAASMSGASLFDSSVSVAELIEPQVGSTAPQEPAVFLAGDRLRVLRCRIIARDGRRGRLTALGGVQIGGDSTDVEIADTLVQGGNGAGIVLGSIDFRPVEVVQTRDLVLDHYRARVAAPTYASALVLAENDCITIDPRPRPPADPQDPVEQAPISDGPVIDCRIARNRILDMGGSGITVAFWFDPEEETDSIITDRLRIDGNEILRCMRLPVSDLTPELREIVAFGGITLATGAGIVIRENRIIEVGTRHGSPIVGIFVLDAEAIEIQGNHLRDNGRIADLQSQVAIGRAGGILLALVRPSVDFFAPFGDDLQARQDGGAACVVEDNTVSAREGRALTVVGVGPMMIHGNRLTAHGSNSIGRIPITGAVQGRFNLTTLALIGLLNVRQTQNPLLALLDVLGGATVAVLNLGVSNEIYLQLLGFSGLGLVDPQQQPEAESFDDDIRLLANGNVMFNDNQVVLDSLSPAVTLTLSSILLISLDDISVADNQSDCDMFLDFVGINTVAIGWSVRMQNNRMKEGIINAFLSGLTAGLMNATSYNQGTHCFTVAGGFQPRIVLTSLSNASAELDTNRHLLPETFCRPFRDQNESLNNGLGLTTRPATTFG